MMNNDQLESQIKQAFSHATPDLLSSVLSDCGEQKGNVIKMTKANTANSLVKKLATAAAALLLVVGGFWGYSSYSAGNAVAAVVSLDVNPSIQIEVNKYEKVLSVNPLNDDAKIVVGDMDFKGSSLDVAVNALIGSMLRNGYLDELANSILISVDNADPALSAALQDKLTQEVNDLLQTQAFSGAVLSQTVKSDAAVKDLATRCSISDGKAQLIKQLAEQNPRYQADELAKLSVNQLNLLIKSNDAQLEQVKSVGSASDKAYIGEAKAQSIAIAHAKADAAKATVIEAELDFDDGVMVYEVEFHFNGVEYDYEIDALSGDVLQYESEKLSAGQAGQQGGGQQGGQAGPRQPVYYDDDDDDDDLDDLYDDDYRNTAGNGNAYRNQDQVSAASYIGEAKAKSLALAKAGLAEGDVSLYRIELDSDDGVAFYEVEFISDGYEYNVEVNALSGAIESYEQEAND